MIRNWQPDENGFTFFFEIAMDDQDEFDYPNNGGIKFTVLGLDPQASDEALAEYSKHLIVSGKVRENLETDIGEAMFLPIPPDIFFHFYESVLRPSSSNRLH